MLAGDLLLDVKEVISPLLWYDLCVVQRFHYGVITLHSDLKHLLQCHVISWP